MPSLITLSVIFPIRASEVYYVVPLVSPLSKTIRL